MTVVLLGEEFVVGANAQTLLGEVCDKKNIAKSTCDKVTPVYDSNRAVCPSEVLICYFGFAPAGQEPLSFSHS
jgi:hypothetical protein